MGINKKKVCLPPPVVSKVLVFRSVSPTRTVIINMVRDFNTFEIGTGTTSTSPITFKTGYIVVKTQQTIKDITIIISAQFNTKQLTG